MPRRAELPARLHPGLLTLVGLVAASPGGARTPAEPKGLPAEGETSLLDLGAPGPKLGRPHPACPAALAPTTSNPEQCPAGAQKPELTQIQAPSPPTSVSPQVSSPGTPRANTPP